MKQETQYREEVLRREATGMCTVYVSDYGREKSGFEQDMIAGDGHTAVTVSTTLVLVLFCFF